MIQRNVGFEISAQRIRMAIIDKRKHPPTVAALLQRDISAPAEIGTALLEMLEQAPRFSDHFCTALPWHQCFVRSLSFPFRDKAKIDAAAQIELESKIPADIGEYTVASAPAVETDQGFATTSVAVPDSAIAACLAPLDEMRLPLQLLGLSPFAEAAGVLAWHRNVLVVKVHADQFGMCSVTDGHVSAFKNCGPMETEPARLAQKIDQEAHILWHGRSAAPQPLCLMGEHVDATLKDELIHLQHELVEPDLQWDGNPVPPEFLPVCAMALAREEHTINLRRGKFALRGGWSSIKKHLYAGIALIGVSAILAGTTAGFIYRHKQEQVRTYKAEMTKIFRQTLPEINVMVDIPRQIQAELEQLKKTATLLGLGDSSALAALREVSRLAPEDIQLDIKRFRYETDALDLSGETTDFDGVNRLGEQLRQSPMFSNVRISDAKMGLDGKTVSFRLQIDIATSGGQQ